MPPSDFAAASRTVIPGRTACMLQFAAAALNSTAAAKSILVITATSALLNMVGCFAGSSFPYVTVIRTSKAPRRDRNCFFEALAICTRFLLRGFALKDELQGRGFLGSRPDREPGKLAYRIPSLRGVKHDEVVLTATATNTTCGLRLSPGVTRSQTSEFRHDFASIPRTTR